MMKTPSVPDERITPWSQLMDRLYTHAWASTNYRTLIIPAEPKWEIRDKPDQGNISERVLFPGLDGLRWWYIQLK